MVEMLCVCVCVSMSGRLCVCKIRISKLWFWCMYMYIPKDSSLPFSISFLYRNSWCNLSVMVLVIIIFLSPPSSGFWGVLCVGIFSRPCLIRELFEGLCFCCESVLPDTVSMYYCTVMLLVAWHHCTHEYWLLNYCMTSVAHT